MDIFSFISSISVFVNKLLKYKKSLNFSIFLFSIPSRLNKSKRMLLNNFFIKLNDLAVYKSLLKFSNVYLVKVNLTFNANILLNLYFFWKAFKHFDISFIFLQYKSTSLLVLNLSKNSN